MSLRPELVDKINKLSLAKNVPIHQIEKLAIGLSHAEIGEKIAASWNFPTNLVKAIGDHHQPRLSNEEHRPMVYTTYLANILCKRPEAESVFSTIEEKVLEFFEIDSVKTLGSIIHTLDEFYLTASEALNV
ncbi:MAG TPA: HDOD domain-containing protein [Spirochaetes bacterium]|nr:HDOD domain-containing protein [Spirochaetota bacterium]